MRLKIRYLSLLIVLASLGSIVYGFTLLEKCIGFGVVGIFLLAMPLFLIFESRGKRMKDYMLTDENIRKMKDPKKES